MCAWGLFADFIRRWSACCAECASSPLASLEKNGRAVGWVCGVTDGNSRGLAGGKRVTAAVAVVSPRRSTSAQQQQVAS